MATMKQRNAAKENIKKARGAWKRMSSAARARSQPEGQKRSRPGAKGTGNFFRIVVRPRREFVAFRNQDVGSPGGLQRVAGRRRNGVWDTQAWLISKNDAHITEDEELVGDSRDARELLGSFESPPEHDQGDIFNVKAYF